MSNTSYQGYSSYPTWAVALWLDNDEGSQNMVEEMAQAATSISNLQDQLKDLIEEEAPELSNSMYSDIFTWAMSQVNWYELAKSYFEEYHSDPEEEEIEA